jgi:hypothetical protein
LTFINVADPGTSAAAIYVCMQPMTAVLSAGAVGAGMIPIPPGGWVVINGVGSAGWNGIAAADAALTIIVQ